MTEAREFNFTKWVAGSLTDKHVLFKAREVVQTGECHWDALQQWKKTDKEAIAPGKHLMTGPQFTTGNFWIGPAWIIQKKKQKGGRKEV